MRSSGLLAIVRSRVVVILRLATRYLVRSLDCGQLLRKSWKFWWLGRPLNEQTWLLLFFRRDQDQIQICDGSLSYINGSHHFLKTDIWVRPD